MLQVFVFLLGLGTTLLSYVGVLWFANVVVKTKVYSNIRARTYS